MTKTKPQSPKAASPSGKLSNNAKSKLQSLFKAQGIEKPDSSSAAITSASKQRWSASQAGTSPAHKALKVQVTGQTKSKPTIDEEPKTVVESNVNGIKPTRNQKRKEAKLLKKKALAESLNEIAASAEDISTEGM